jgi:glycosyltransferase involved in cell wall biosynthesis
VKSAIINGIDIKSPKTSNVSVFIMTYNEEINIQRCLDAVCWSNDVAILDSYSQDRTIELACNYPNVRICHRAFDDYGRQRNYGIHEIPYRNPWLLVVDADEVVEPSLALEILAVASSGPSIDEAVFLLRRKVFLDGRWVRRSISNNFWHARLFRPDFVHYDGPVHERVCFRGDYGRLKGALEHHQFAKGIEDWKARRKRYAQMEIESCRGNPPPMKIGDLFTKNCLSRRAAIKSLFYRLPARWAFYFLFNVLFKFPYLDGLVGLRYLILETSSQHLARTLQKDARNARTH